jgi:TonB family protein
MNIVLTPLLGLLIATSAKSDITKASTESMKDPVIVSVIKPAYPEFARLHKIQGTVLVRLSLDENGVPSDAKVVRSASPSLEHAALSAAMNTKFIPARSVYGPVKSMVDIPFVFKIQ